MGVVFSTRHALGALALAAVAFGLAPAPAAAQETSAVVLQFSGRGRARVRNTVVRALEGELALMPVSDAEAFASGEGIDLDSAVGMRRMAQTLGVRLIVSGSVRGRGRRAQATIRFFDENGAELASERASARPGNRGRTAITRAARDALATALASLPAPEPAAPTEPWYGQEEENPEPEEAEEDGSPSGGLPRLRALVGIQARDRFAEVGFVGSLGSAGYSAPFHSEISLRVESFFLGNSPGAARGLYAQFDFAHSVGISSQDQDGNEFDTSAWRLLIQGGYLYPIRNDFLRLGPLVGFGVDRFSIGTNPILPSSSYTFVRTGAAASFALLDNVVRARLDVAYRFVFGAGDLADAFGVDTSLWAIDVAAEIGGIYKRFTYAFRTGVVRYDLAFSGDATVPEAISTETVEGKDRSYFLELQLGFAL